MSQANPSSDPVTIDSLCAQIEGVGRTANRLIEALIEQRNEARAVLTAIEECLEYRPGDIGHVQVIEGKGAVFWEILYELKRNAT